jgi:transcription elongation factor GreA
METTPKTLYLSKKGMKELKKSIAQLERDLQKSRLDLRELDKSTAREERMIYSEKIGQLEIIESDLLEKGTQIPHVKLLPRKRDAMKVALGSVVDLIDSTGRLVRYQIVDSLEANPSDGRISADSPLGQTLVGRTIKDTIEWGRGLKTQQFKLVAIS